MAGGIPIIAAINECLAANQIESIHAILNGTSNFILSQMEEQETDYASALAEAQQRGYAEANPSMDVNGSDAAQKLAILAHLAFGVRADWRKIPRMGIDVVQVTDIRYARELGYSIKLLAVAELVPEGLELHVSPTLVRQGHAAGRGPRGVQRHSRGGRRRGAGVLPRPGAGQMPTASAVVADLIDTVLGRTAITFRTLNLWPATAQTRVLPRDPATIPGRFYLRFNVDDRPGVMAEITGILGGHKISIASVIQHETIAQQENVEDESACVPMILMTHVTAEGAVHEALQAINRLACVHPGTIRMRVRN